MACVNCSKIRTAILHGKMAEAAGLSVEVLREKFGLNHVGDEVPAGDPVLVGEASIESLAPAKAPKAK